MKTIKQLLRQKGKSVFGVILMTLAVAILCICVGQSIAARTTILELEDSFATIGLQEGVTENNGIASKEMMTWLENLAQEHPEIVKAQEYNGILSAYIPELTPLHFTMGEPYLTTFTDSLGIDGLEAGPEGMPYTCAALTFTLEEMTQPQENIKVYYLNQRLQQWEFEDQEEFYAYRDTLEKKVIHSGYTVTLYGTVSGVVALQEGFRDPTGMRIRLTVQVMTLEELEAFDFVIGSEYLTFGMDYTDEDWILRSRFASGEYDKRDPWVIEEFDLTKLNVLSGKELEQWLAWKGDSDYYIPYAIYGGWKMLTEEQCAQINTVSMTLGLIRNPHRFERDEIGAYTSIEKVDEWTVTMYNSDTYKIPVEEYLETYRLPMLARIETTVEDFLESEEGAVWRDTLEWRKYNDNAFAVIGTEKLSYIADFAKGNARVVAGRDFTEEEIEQGQRVCLINETLAAENDIRIGQTITLSMYDMDQALPYFQRMLYIGNIPAYFYYPTEKFVDTAEYTIVGFWRGEQLWTYDFDQQCALLPNTMIVPESSVQAEMTTIPTLSFSALVLYNGQVETFKALATQAGYGDAYVFYDQGYTAISENFHNYDDMAQKVLMVGAALYGVLLLLFLLLFPVSRRRSVLLMESLGEPFGKRFANVAAYAASVLIPASVLGGIVGAAAWQSVVSKLVGATESTITMVMDPLVIAGLTLAQCVWAFILSALVAIPVARSFGMSKKR